MSKTTVLGLCTATGSLDVRKRHLLSSRLDQDGVPLRINGRFPGHGFRWGWAYLLFALAFAVSASASAHSFMASQKTRTSQESGDDKPGQVNPSEKTEAAPSAEAGRSFSAVTLAEGQVTNAFGGGQQGVRVVAYEKTAEGTRGKLLAETATNEFGDFTLTAAKPTHGDIGDIIVTLTKASYATITHELHVEETDSPPFLAEILEGTLVVSGVVVSELDHKPIPQASATLNAFYREWTVETDDTGRFTIRGVPPGTGTLSVEAKGYGRERTTLKDLSEEDAVTVALKPERIVEIQIVDDLGQTVPGVTVETYDPRRDDLRTVVSAEDGTATLRGVHFDTSHLDVRLSKDNHVSSQGFDKELLLPKEKTRSNHKLTMLRAGQIHGTIVDLTGAPVYGARVMTGTTPGDTSPRDWSDPQGRFNIQGVPPGPATVTVHRSGFAPELKTVDVKAGETTTLHVHLKSPATISGIVTDKKGKPIAGLTVAATKWRGADTLGLRAMTDHKGRFVIENAPHGKFDIAVLERSLEGERNTRTVRADSSQPLTIVVDDAPAVPVFAEGKAPKIGDDAPEVVMTSLRGQRLEMTKLKGKTVLMDFWATWCGPCVAEMPELTAVYKKFGSRDDFVMIGISLDGDKRALRSFLKKRKIGWHQVFGETDGAIKAAEEFGASALPATFVIGPNGKIAASGLRGPDIMRQVEKSLRARKPK